MTNSFIFTCYDVSDAMRTKFEVSIIPLCTKIQIGQEICPTTGNTHWQGRLTFKGKETVSKTAADIILMDTKGKNIWCKRAKYEDSTYELKDGNIIFNIDNRKTAGRPAATPKPPRKPVRVISSLKPWQRNLAGRLKKEPDDTTIYWYWEDVGGCGKTSFAKWACVKDELGKCLMVGGRAIDVKFAVSESLDAGIEYDCIFFNVARSGSVSYRALEDVKDGAFFSSKYKSGMCLFNPPHVVVFANRPPTIDYMSPHKWVIVEIVDYDAYGLNVLFK